MNPNRPHRRSILRRPSVPAARLFGACLLLALLAGAASAQRYHIHTYSGADGLGSNIVLGMTQDVSGRLWFATRRGLVRYDGRNWTDCNLYANSYEHGVRSVEADATGAVWTIPFLPPVQVTCVEPDGTVRRLPVPDTFRPVHEIQLLCVDRTAGRERVALSTVGREVLLWSDGAWRNWALDDRWGAVNALLFHDGTLLAATEGGLLMLEGDVFVQEPRVAPFDGPVHSLCAGHDGSPWVVGVDWIGRLRPAGLELVGRGLDHDLIPTSGGIASAEGPAGDLYYGDYRFCYHFHPRRPLERLDVDSGLIGSGATDILVDREGLVWITTMRGVSKLISRRFVGYDIRHGLLRDEVSSVLDLGEQGMLLGHEGGLTLLGDRVRTYPLEPDVDVSAFRFERYSRVMALSRGPDGKVWVSGSRAGVGVWTEEGGIAWERFPSERLGSVYSVHFDSEGTRWLGCDRGVFRCEGDDYVKVGLPVDKTLVRRIEGARDGSVLICTGHDGLVRIRPDGAEAFRLERGQAANSTYDVQELPDGRLWVATAVGLREARDGKLLPLGPDDPQVRDAVYAILIDGYDRIWFGTDSGVGYWRDGKLRRYHQRDGLIGTEVNRDALKIDSRGVVWIGTDRGVSAFDPQYDLPHGAPPLVEILGYDVGAGLEPFDGNLRLGTGPLSLSVSFAGLSFVDEKNLRFRTRLEGLEDDWHESRLIPERMVRYTNLMPGGYRFHVEALGADGQPGPEAVSAEIRIDRPLWQRIEVRLLSLLFLLLFLWFGFSALAGRRYAQRLEKEVEQRTALLALSEQRFRQESERLAATLDSISDGVLALDADGCVLMANPACGRILAREVDSLIGSPVEDVLPASVRSRREVMTDGAFRVVARDGEERWLEVSSADLLGPDGRGEGSVLAFRDVTDRRRSEAERVRSQRLESLGVLAGGIAHDFNNLLTVVLGNAALVAETESLSEADREALESVVRAGSRARTLTRQLLTFSRGGAPRRQSVQLREIVDEALNLCLSGTQVVAELDLPDDLPDVDVDTGQIGQVVSNLLINAVQAMPDGGRVHLSASLHDTARGRRVRLAVEDEGPGVPPEIAEQIFEPYFTTKEGGSGLGLAIAYSVAARHEGSLACTTGERGARFVLELPAATREPVPPTAAAPAPTGADRPAAPGRVLVLDDDPQIRLLMRRILERIGARVVDVADGAEAVAEYRSALARDARFDAVVLDMTIPGGMGGLEAFREIRALDADAVGIVVSGYSHDAVLADPARHGFAAGLGKPFDPAVFEATVLRLLASGV